METNRHHLWFSRRDMLKKPEAAIIRAYPFNIHETETNRHQQLHRALGSLAIPSDNFCRELIEWAKGLPSEAMCGHERGSYFLQEIEYIEVLARVRNGTIKREADYFAGALSDQMPFMELK